MQLKTMYMLKHGMDKDLVTDTHLSFKPFLNYVRLRLQDEDSVKKDVLRLVLEKFSPYPELEQNIPLDGLDQYKSLFDLLHVVLSNVVEDERKVFWGLCVPMSPLLLYGSNPFYQLIEDAINVEYELEEDSQAYEDFAKSKLETFYAHILWHFYGIPFFAKTIMVRSITDSNTRLTRNYQLSLNTDFVEVKVKGTLPAIDDQLMELQADDSDVMAKLQQLLPVEMFSFTGFTVITVADVTQRFALDSIRDRIVHNRAEGSTEAFPAIIQSLKELVGSNEVEFNILPLFKINGKFVDDLDAYCQSILFADTGLKTGIANYSLPLIEQFIAKPKLLYYGDLDTAGPSNSDVARVLKATNVKAYVLFPVYYNQKMVGAIEAYSFKKALITERFLSALDPAKELLAQLMQNCLADFQDEIDSVIKEKFTSLQPSVQWKFNEVAWHFLQKKKSGVEAPEPDKIIFEHVHPLYGGIDIRNSTIERNEALNKDLSVQFEVLLDVLQQLKQQTGFMLLDERIYETRRWIETIKPNASLFYQQPRLTDFLENDILPFLRQFSNREPGIQAIADKYFDAVDERTGIAHQYKRQLEKSMSLVVSAVNSYINDFRKEVQQAYPCYFEKFRTDGVEYDIYIGQSITPGKPYSEIFLKNLRLMQLSSMATLTRLTHNMQPKLLTPVETTQLIFVHSNAIDIRFRRDEKRFDVEGAYNIRYHVVKKRIDKVHIKDTEERLTQPGKIAVVYFNQKEATEYSGYINYLQQNHILNNDLEFLELEELQGVSGLKAIRVGVNLQLPAGNA
jgi:hypothetical protein